MNIVYRISDNGYSKEKPEYISNEKCLKNLCDVFSDYLSNIHILADKVTDDTFRMIEGCILPSQIERTDIGHGALVLNHHL
jgi:regulator of sigma D